MEKKKKNSKVTLLELVATKIIYAMLIVVYYWMWARRDWKDFYDEIQYAVGVFTVIFLLSQASRIRKFNKELVDELALANLKRADSICLKIALAGSIAVSFAGALEVVNNLQMGYIIMFMMLAITILRTVIFYVMD
ncbi:MAG: hypothetical protein II312_10440, partial [Lachnospiraceae bacterium]|nr:hypothetical protein [Lachnospiraceae bacterium]